MFHLQSQFTQGNMQGAAKSEHGQQANLLVAAFDVAYVIAMYPGHFSQLLLGQTGI